MKPAPVSTFDHAETAAWQPSLSVHRVSDVPDLPKFPIIEGHNQGHIPTRSQTEVLHASASRRPQVSATKWYPEAAKHDAARLLAQVSEGTTNRTPAGTATLIGDVLDESASNVCAAEGVHR